MEAGVECVVVNLSRLSFADSSLSYSNANIQNIIVPFLGTGAFNSIVDWNFTSTPQVGMNNRTVPLSRGFVLGGSSSISA